MKTAVIDVGTLKAKFDIREYDESSNHKMLYKDKKLTVLGRDLDKTGGLIIERAINETITALNEFREKMNEFGVDTYRAVTTEAIRQATNAEEVLGRIEAATSIRLEPLSHQDEAEIYFRSVSKDFPDQIITVSDIGGGSVQVVIGKDQDIYETYLFKTGTYFMQEELSKTQHPTLEELANAKQYVRGQMGNLANTKYQPEVLVYGSTNIIDFLQAMQVNFEGRAGQSDHPSQTRVDQLIPVYEEIIKYPYKERMKMYPAEPYYMWSAENALINIFQIAEYLKLSTVVPSNNNIATGIHYELAKDRLNSSSRSS